MNFFHRNLFPETLFEISFRRPKKKSETFFSLFRKKTEFETFLTAKTKFVPTKSLKALNNDEGFINRKAKQGPSLSLLLVAFLVL